MFNTEDHEWNEYISIYTIELQKGKILNNKYTFMKASEAAKIAEETQVRIGHEYNTVIKIIKAHAEQGDREINLPQSAVPKKVIKELEKDGYVCSYSFRDCKISW